MGCYVQCFNYRETRLLFCTKKLFEKHRRKSDILSKGVRITVTDLYDSLEYHSYAGIFDMFCCSSSAAWFLHGWSIECKWVREAVSCEIVHSGKSLISIFQEISSSISKAFILAGGFGTGLSFYGV